MNINADIFNPYLEIGVYEFGSFDDWKNWRRQNPWFGFTSAPKEIADHCLANGIASDWFGHIPPEKVSCATLNYRESLRGNGFNPRQRAVLETLLALTKGREQEVRIYAAEGITPLAKEIARRYPNFVGSEYAPAREDQVRIAPIEHQDLAALTYDNESFDICITNEVFEHLPDLETSIMELHRVLVPGGLLICTFPFLHNRLESVTKARLTESGTIDYLMEPEYHGNPVDPDGGSLVFQVPAWDILAECREAGFKHASLYLLVSRKAGIASRDYAGIFTLFARKP